MLGAIDFSNPDVINAINITICFFGVFVIGIMLISYRLQNRRGVLQSDPLFFWLAATFLVAILSEGITWMLPVEGSLFYVFWLDLAYVCFEITIVLFHVYILHYLRKNVHFSESLYHVATPIAVIESVVWISSYWTKIFYVFSGNTYLHAKYYIFSQLGGIYIILFDIALILYYFKNIPRREYFAWIFYCAGSMVAVVLNSATPITVLYLSTTFVVLLLYLQINIQTGVLLAQYETQIEKQKTQVAYSQMEPHFLYNTISAIMGIESCSPQVRESLGTFARYLRENLNYINTEGCISFQKELEHVKKYAELEMLRFDDVFVKYDIESEDFQVPPLCVQILVENAIKHGVSAKEGGGTVYIRQREEKDRHVIWVTDDGLGFDPEITGEDGTGHIGLQNVNWRLKELVNGTMSIQSKLGSGTTVMICIPKEVGEAE